MKFNSPFAHRNRVETVNQALHSAPQALHSAPQAQLSAALSVGSHSRNLLKALVGHANLHPIDNRNSFARRLCRCMTDY
jgi:hypothetical protein